MRGRKDEHAKTRCQSMRVVTERTRTRKYETEVRTRSSREGLSASIGIFAIPPFGKNAGVGGSQESQREVEEVEDPNPSPVPRPPKTRWTEVEALN